jgi:hypothetical protein
MYRIHAVMTGTTKQSPVESEGLILVYMYIKWCIPVVLVVFLYIFYNIQQNKYLIIGFYCNIQGDQQ